MSRSPARETRRPAKPIRAFGAEAAEAQVLRRMDAVHRLGADAGEIARALRQARKAAFAPLGAYDPVGHAALIRLSKASQRTRSPWRPLFGKP